MDARKLEVRRDEVYLGTCMAECDILRGANLTNDQRLVTQTKDNFFAI